MAVNLRTYSSRSAPSWWCRPCAWSPATNGRVRHKVCVASSKLLPLQSFESQKSLPRPEATASSSSCWHMPYTQATPLFSMAFTMCFFPECPPVRLFVLSILHILPTSPPPSPAHPPRNLGSLLTQLLADLGVLAQLLMQASFQQGGWA